MIAPRADMPVLDRLIQKFCHYSELVSGTARITKDELWPDHPRHYHVTMTDDDRQALIAILKSLKGLS